MRGHELIAAAALVATLATPASGQPPGQPPTPPGATSTAAEPMPRLSLTISPIHLFLPFVELMGEYRLGDRGISAAVILGAGSIDPNEDPGEPESDERFDLYEFGGQVRYYVFGDFTGGVQIGIELAYVAASTDDDEGLAAEGFVTGAFAGYKRAFYDHYTLDLQAGVQRFFVRTKTDDDSEVQPLININVGYTF